DGEAGEGGRSGEPLGANGALRVMTVAVGARRAPVSFYFARVIDHRRYLRVSGMALDQQLDPVAQLIGELGRGDDPGVLAEPEDPGDQLAGVRVRGDEHPVAVVGR